MNSFFIWLFLVIGWNFIFPNASPFLDVIMAILIKFTSEMIINKL